MYIIELTYIQPTEQIDLLLEEHKAFLEKYYASGNFLLSGRKNPRTGGIILAIANDRQEIQDIITQDPFNRYGVAIYAVTEFFPTMTAPDLQFLSDSNAH